MTDLEWGLEESGVFGILNREPLGSELRSQVIPQGLAVNRICIGREEHLLPIPAHCRDVARSFGWVDRPHCLLYRFQAFPMGGRKDQSVVVAVPRSQLK